MAVVWWRLRTCGVRRSCQLVSSDRRLVTQWQAIKCNQWQARGEDLIYRPATWTPWTHATVLEHLETIGTWSSARLYLNTLPTWSYKISYFAALTPRNWHTDLNCNTWTFCSWVDGRYVGFWCNASVISVLHQWCNVMPHAVLLTRIRTDDEMDRRRKQRWGNKFIRMESEIWDWHFVSSLLLNPPHGQNSNIKCQTE